MYELLIYLTLLWTYTIYKLSVFIGITRVISFFYKYYKDRFLYLFYFTYVDDTTPFFYRLHIYLKGTAFLVSSVMDKWFSFIWSSGL